jgi:hypothetical protein
MERLNYSPATAPEKVLMCATAPESLDAKLMRVALLGTPREKV